MSIQLGTHASPIDLGVLESYRALQESGQPDIVTELIDMFLDDLPSRLEQFRRVIDARDAAAIQRSAHALKGASATLGANALAGLCDYVEATARAGSVDLAVDLLGENTSEAERCREALVKERRA